MRRGYGFTLIEVMIALFVLGIGLLGVAGLQSVSTSMGAQSAMRTEAVMLARDMSDRMRANQTAVDNGGYDMGGGASPSQNGSCTTNTGTCGPGQLASHDLWQWTRSVDNALPRPPSAGNPQDRAYVCIDSTPSDGTVGSQSCDGTGNNYVVKIWWYDTEGNTASGNPDGDVQRFVTELQPDAP